MRCAWRSADAVPGPGCCTTRTAGVSQYAAAAYRAVLVAEGMIASMSRKGNCWDNAVAESFFATLEWELIERHRWKTQDEARSAVFEYIETWYNARRRHSSLGDVSPAAYELALRQGAAA